MNDRRKDCFKCKHYFVSWDPHAPKGCRIHNFKSRELPSLVVFQSSGNSCLAFSEKADNKKKELDLNRKDLW